MAKDTSKRCCNPWQLWIKICHFYNRLIEDFFGKLGEIVPSNPLKVILASLLIMALLASGFAFMETENRTEKLYIPQDSESITNLKKAKDYGFYRPKRSTEVIILNQAGKNVLTKECFQDAISLHNKITNITGYTELCLPMGDKPVGASADCVTKEPLRAFNYSSNNLENILVKLNGEETSKGMPLDGILGRISRDSFGQITAAEAIRLVYYLKDVDLGEEISEKALNWEKEFLTQMKASEDLQCGSIFYTSKRSLDDAISASVVSDTKLITITFVVMISFACFMLGKYRNLLSGHGLLAMGGVMSVVLGIMTAFGLAMFCGIPFVSIVGILPFLIVGVGIDDMFIIVDELDRSNPDQTIPERLSKVMRHAGPAITMTTLTDLLAFAVGTTSKFPSIVHFCTYAALAISFSFLFLVSTFVAFMAYDCKRMNAGRMDMLPCLKAPSPATGNPRWDEPQPQTSNKIMGWWGKILMKPVTKAVVVLLSISLLGISIYGSTFINEEFSRKDLAKDGSEFVKFLNTLDTYFTEDIKVDVILEPGLNYSNTSTQEDIANLTHIIKSNHYYRAHLISWFDEFRIWYNKNGSTVPRNFMISLQQFLGSNPRFRGDISLSKDNKTVQSSRLICFMKQTASAVDKRDAMTSLRSDLSEKSSLSVFASAYSFIFFEQFVLILPETIRNLGLAGAAIVIITTLFLVNPLVVFLVLVSFVSLIFELLGLMYVWDVSLNSISMINLVMAIGFAVDYSAHVAHSFVFSHETIPKEKVIDALRTVGASVFMGGFSTFLGTVVTAFASAEIFRIFFKMFFGIVVLGLLHGLCFLPVWLSIICRFNVDVHSQNGSVNHSQNSPAAVHDEKNSPTSDCLDGARMNAALNLNEINGNANLHVNYGQSDAAGKSNIQDKNTSPSPRINPGFEPCEGTKSKENSNGGDSISGNISDTSVSVETKS